MPEEDQKPGKKFTFVNLTNPLQADQDIVRKRVRSVAALDGWAEIARPRLARENQSVKTKAKRNKRKVAVVPSTSSKSSSSNNDGHDSLSVTVSSGSPDHQSSLVEDWELGLTRLQEEQIMSMLSLPTLGSGDRDPFNAYPVEAKPWFGWVLHYFKGSMVPKGYKALKVFNTTIIRRNDIYTDSLMMREPALFYMFLFRACAHLIPLGLIPPSTSFWLRGKTITALNSALEDPKKSATDDALILTVACIAAHEALHGDKNTARLVHAQAARKMVQMAGGIMDWDAPKMLKDVVVFYDNTVALITGMERAYDEFETNFNINHLEK